MTTPPVPEDEELRNIYERCDVSSNRTDNPLSFKDFTALIHRRETEARARTVLTCAGTLVIKGMGLNPAQARSLDKLHREYLSQLPTEQEKTDATT
jgi:hypothetical protein